jgi:hypothetical protein
MYARSGRGADHSSAQGFTLAMARSVAFFNRYLK